MSYIFVALIFTVVGAAAWEYLRDHFIAFFKSF